MRLEHREGSLSPSSAPAPTTPLAAFPPLRCPLPSSPCGHSHWFPSHFHLKGRGSWPLSVGEGLGTASLLRSPQPPGLSRPHADSPQPPAPYVGEQGQDDLSSGGLDGGRPSHPHWRALGPPRFPSFPPSWASGEPQRWGLPEGLGAAWLHFCAHPTMGGGGMDQRREALAG